MLRSLIYILFVAFIVLSVVNFNILNSSAEGLEYASEFGRCLIEKSKTKTDCGFDPIEHYKGPMIAGGFAHILAALNLVFLMLITMLALWVRFKLSSKRKSLV